MASIEVSIPNNLEREKSILSTTPDQVEEKENATYNNNNINNNEEEENILIEERNKEFNEVSKSSLVMENNRENAFSKVSSRLLNSSFRISSQYNKKLSPPPPPPATDYDFNSVGSYIQGEPLTNGFVLTKVNPVLDPDFLYLNRNKLVNRRLILRKNNPSLCDFAFENNRNNLIDRPVTEFTLSSSANLNRLWNNNSSLDKTTANNQFKNIRSYNLEKSKTMDLNGPSPTTYKVPRKLPTEKSSPFFTIGKRCFKEKNGGGRTSWEKEWFNSKDPFTIKSDFIREQHWPSPTNYRIKSTLGERGSQTSVHQRSPAHAFGPPKNKRPIGLLTFVGVGVIKSNSGSKLPLDADTLISAATGLLDEDEAAALAQRRRRSSSAFGHVMESVNRVKSSSPKVTLKFRHNGTELWPKVETTPGPGAYDERKFGYVHKKTPKFTVPHSQLTSLKSNFNNNLGPFAI